MYIKCRIFSRLSPNVENRNMFDEPALNPRATDQGPVYPCRRELLACRTVIMVAVDWLFVSVCRSVGGGVVTTEIAAEFRRTSTRRLDRYLARRLIVMRLFTFSKRGSRRHTAAASATHWPLLIHALSSRACLRSSHRFWVR